MSETPTTKPKRPILVLNGKGGKSAPKIDDLPGGPQGVYVEKAIGGYYVRWICPEDEFVAEVPAVYTDREKLLQDIAKYL